MSNRRLVAFLYTLMRDELVPGAVEGIVADIEQTDAEFGEPVEFDYSNTHLEEYARELAWRLEED